MLYIDPMGYWTRLEINQENNESRINLHPNIYMVKGCFKGPTKEIVCFFRGPTDWAVGWLVLFNKIHESSLTRKSLALYLKEVIQRTTGRKKNTNLGVRKYESFSNWWFQPI